MALAVCLLSDRRTERRLVHLWQAIEAAGIASLPSHTHGRHVPHLSYAVLRTFDVEAVRAALGDLAALAYDVLPVDGVADRLALVDSASGRRWFLDRVV